ncbi:MAG: Sua5/YciO/YrdC/YwlC family protein, partial [Clostridiales bacterium]|nr:Sua5/YciO/YrdC/YwlC family protein [Clostridiales bacterium]
MRTKVFDLRQEYEQGLDAAAQEIARGGLVIFPTETVYGIGADAQNVQAVRQIFAVKGRPMDNPLIAHVCEMSQVY